MTPVDANLETRADARMDATSAVAPAPTAAQTPVPTAAPITTAVSAPVTPPVTTPVVGPVAGPYPGSAPRGPLLIRPGWGEAADADVGAIASDVRACFDAHLRGRDLRPVLLSLGGDEAPEIRYAVAGVGGALAEVRWITLALRGRFWAQLVHQFAHEYVHAFSNCDRDRSPGVGWVEESLCEAGSLFALRQLAVLWAHRPPHEVWRPFAPNFATYAADRIAGYRAARGDVPFPAWLAARRAALALDRYRRADNGVVALELLDLLEGDPRRWAALEYLNLGATRADKTLEAYLGEWAEAAPPDLQPFVEFVAGLLAPMPTTPTPGTTSPGGGSPTP